MTGNILVIDDSKVERKIVSKAIKKRYPELNIIEAEHGFDIITQLLSNNIHVCVLDILMPEKDGFEILEEIKRDVNTMDIPIIVCTGISDKTAIEKALSLGAYDYFLKPLNEEAVKISLPIKVKNAIDLMKRKEEIIYLSYHDKLTGVYNRRYAEEEMLRLDNERNLPFSLIMGDVNGLKLTNDAFGHEAGDRLLKKITEAIKNECRKDEIIARIGGDEFLILLPKTEETEVINIISRIKIHCENEKEDPIKPSISFGYGIKQENHQSIVTVFKEAEDQMYNNKLLEGAVIKTSIITSLIKNINQRSPFGNSHMCQLKEIAAQIGEELNFSSEQIDSLKLLVDFHDIGLTAIPESELGKNGSSNASKVDAAYKTHSEIGYRIANSVTDLEPIAKSILSHHENWDGSGYPQGLRGEEISLKARIMSILDTYDIMLNGNTPQAQQNVLNYIKSKSGTFFDPNIVAILIKVLEKKASQ